MNSSPIQSPIETKGLIQPAITLAILFILPINLITYFNCNYLKRHK